MAKQSIKKVAKPKTKKPKKVDYTRFTNRTLFNKANKGDRKAESELNKRRKELARQANKLLRELEKAGKTDWAYKRATTYTKTEFNGSKRFRIGEKFVPFLKDKWDEIVELEGFLNMPSSDVKKYIEAERKRAEYFRKIGLNVPRGQEHNFSQLLESQIFHQFCEMVGSDVALEDISDMFGKGLNIKQIDSLLSKIMEEEINEFEWDDYAANLNWIRN